LIAPQRAHFRIRIFCEVRIQRLQRITEAFGGDAKAVNLLPILGFCFTLRRMKFVALGFEHILSGIDHVFFVIGLILLVPALGRLIGALTAFTVAHSITLGAAALGFAGLPQASVEVVIALSILVVGYEVVRASRGRTGLTYAMPWAVAFGFGLLHGFGFAGALAEIGLPQDAKLSALLLFNLGVETGQLMIVAVAVPLARWIAGRAAGLRRRIEVGAGYSLGAAAAFWMIQRVVAVM